MQLNYTRWMRLGQLSGLVCAFLYLIAVVAPLLLGAEPAHALSWALYYEIGRTFSLLNLAGDEQKQKYVAAGEEPLPPNIEKANDDRQGENHQPQPG